jgi:arabinofuranosyltransferase
MTSKAGSSATNSLPRADCEKPLSAVDFIVLAGLAVFTAVYVRSHVNWRGLPAEDALMLLRYSRHFAEGFGIRWNVGEAPVEGATDFLYMISVGIVSRVTHFGAIASGRILLAIAHLLSVSLIYIGARRLFAWPVWASLCLSLYLAVDIAVAYIAAGFSSPFYGFFALVAWFLTLRCIVCGVTVDRGAGIGVFLALIYLIRPEGVFLDAFILLALWFALGRPALRAIVPAVAVLLVLGGTYFLWRWHYFGYLFPNPFYLKGGGHLHFDALSASSRATWIMLAPLLPFYLVELFSSNCKRALTALIPTIGFTCVWILLSNENNYLMRFQYCGIPLAILSLPYASTTLRERFSGFSLRLIQQAAVVLVVLICSHEYWRMLSQSFPSDFGPYNVAIGMNAFKDKGYTVATTDAGIVPYFSDWRAIDLYGLNDAAIVHNPHGLTEAYLEQRNPEVILDHYPDKEYLAKLVKLHQTDEVTKRFAETHNYELAAVWGRNACDRSLWYVRRDVPEAQQLIAMMRRSPYYFSGVSLLDLRGVPLPDNCDDQVIHLGLSQ